MNRLWILSGLMAALALSGCVTTPEKKTVEPEVVVEQAPLTPEEIELLRKYRLSAGELSIWRSAAFKEQFAESYIAATEIEPPLRSEDERDQLIEIFEDLEPTDEEKALLEASQREKDLIAAGAVAEAAKLQEEREAKAGRKQADRMEKAAIALREMQGEGANAIVDFSLGNIHFQRGEYEEAQKAYEIAVGKYRAFRRAWKNLGIIYIRKEEPDLKRAAEAMTRVIELGGGDGVTYGLLGFCYMSLGRNMAAESAYRMAILLDAETLDWKLGLVQSMYKQGRFPETVALTGTLLKTRPGDAQLWMMQANAYLGQGKTLDAAENFEMVDRLGRSTAASLRESGGRGPG
jgi:tetratricopeptide (TPR) repeat protein